MNGIFDIINVPIGMLLSLCYDLVQNYGVAILLFALITKLCLLPIGIKAEKGRRKMMKAQPRIQQLQQKYKNNTRDPKYQEEMQKIYSEEGYSPTSGCLPQLIQLPLILSLWTNIRQPLTYLLNMSALNIEKLFNAVTALGINYGEKVTYQTVNQLTLIRDINANSDALSGVIAETGYRGINLNFLGLNLGDTPQFAWTITVILPILAALSSLAVTIVSQKINQTDSAAKAPGMNAMLYIMPLITLFLGYSFQIGICIYWIFTNILTIIQTVLLAKLIKEKVPEKPVKEKKLNYNQIQKMERLKKEESEKLNGEDSSAKLNGEAITEENNEENK